MTYSFQVVLDSAQPHVLADWWAETLGWEVESQDEGFIRDMVAQGHAQESDTMTHNGSLVWRVGAALSPPPDSGRPRILFQAVPEENPGKNRMHLDIRVGDDEVAEVVASLVGRGATKLYDGSQGPFTWTTMADPEGNEFCVTPGAG